MLIVSCFVRGVVQNFPVALRSGITGEVPGGVLETSAQGGRELESASSGELVLCTPECAGLKLAPTPLARPQPCCKSRLHEGLGPLPSTGLQTASREHPSARAGRKDPSAQSHGGAEAAHPDESPERIQRARASITSSAAPRARQPPRRMRGSQPAAPLPRPLGRAADEFGEFPPPVVAGGAGRAWAAGSPGTDRKQNARGAFWDL